MCRHLAWLGAPRSLSELILDPPAGLLRQAYAPRRQQHGRINADGWGVGFFDPSGAIRRWRSDRPLWTDTAFTSIAPLLSARCVVAAVRSATPGMPIDTTAAAPFTDGHRLLSHNGKVSRAVLPPSRAAESACDSALLAAHVFETGPDRFVEMLQSLAAADPDARLTMLLTDGARIRGVTWGNDLCYHIEPDGIAVASEPWDDSPDWIHVSDRHLIDVTAEGITITELET